MGAQRAVVPAEKQHPQWEIGAPPAPRLPHLLLEQAMKVFLDDVRLPQDPEWVLVKSAQEVIDLLKTGSVTHMSLDHDLGPGDGTGMDVLVWLERQVIVHGLRTLPYITVHSANPPAARRMWQALERIEVEAARRRDPDNYE